MSAATDDLWRGTTDSRVVLAARLESTPAERLALLGEALELMAATGWLARVRQQRQRESDAWWGASSSED